MKKWMVIAGLGLMLGCSGKIGVADCDRYLEKLDQCADQQHGVAQAAMKGMVEMLHKSWSKTDDKKALESVCKSSLTDAKRAHAECQW
jgi:hypothetical protein